MPVKRNMNWPMLMVTPYPATARQDTDGRGMNSTAGKATRMKRMAPSNMGGKSSSASLMATKFKPQTVTTNKAFNQSRRGISFTHVMTPMCHYPSDTRTHQADAMTDVQ